MPAPSAVASQDPPLRTTAETVRLDRERAIVLLEEARAPHAGSRLCATEPHPAALVPACIAGHCGDS